MQKAHIAACCVTFLLVCLGHAQQPASPQATPATSAHPYTLHVYAHLIQVAALALDSDGQPVPALKPSQFAISLDDGPPFPPTHARLVGDDPISLSVLIDASNQLDLVKFFPATFAQLAPLGLHPKDHVTFYALDCALVHSTVDAPVDPATLKTQIDTALAMPGLHGSKSKAACGNSLRLTDAVYDIAHNLAELPGRRVILILSVGNEAKSEHGFLETSTYIGSKGIAVFGLRDNGLFRRERSAIINANEGFSPAHPFGNDFLGTLCHQNGGVVFKVKENDLITSLNEFVTLVRGRYILNFPLPGNRTAGAHSIVVRVPDLADYVTTTGATALFDTTPPPVDPDAIPSTVTPTPSPATLGTPKN